MKNTNPTPKQPDIKANQTAVTASVSPEAVSASKQNWILGLPKWLMKMVAAMLRAVNKVLSWLGLGPVGGAHTASLPQPAAALSECEMAEKNEPGNEPSMAQMMKLVPIATVKKMLEYAKAETADRKNVDLSKMTAEQKIWLTTLSEVNVNKLKDMKPKEALIVAYKGVSQIQAKMKGLHKNNQNIAALTSEPSMVEAMAAEARDKKDRTLKARIEEEKSRRKERKAPALGFAM